MSIILHDWEQACRTGDEERYQENPESQKESEMLLNHCYTGAPCLALKSTSNI